MNTKSVISTKFGEPVEKWKFSLSHNGSSANEIKSSPGQLSSESVDQTSISWALDGVTIKRNLFDVLQITLTKFLKFSIHQYDCSFSSINLFKERKRKKRDWLFGNLLFASLHYSSFRANIFVFNKSSQKLLFEPPRSSLFRWNASFRRSTRN